MRTTNPKTRSDKQIRNDDDAQAAKEEVEEQIEKDAVDRAAYANRNVASVAKENSLARDLHREQ